jgi:hypothetical protein
MKKYGKNLREETNYILYYATLYAFEIKRIVVSPN